MVGMEFPGRRRRSWATKAFHDNWIQLSIRSPSDPGGQKVSLWKILYGLDSNGYHEQRLAGENALKNLDVVEGRGFEPLTFRVRSC